MTDSPPPPLADDPNFLSSLSGLDRGLAGDSFVAERILPDVAAPLITIPGRRPLLDLFPVFFPSEAEATLQPLPARSRQDAVVSSAPYESFYGLQEHPFSPVADPRFLYHSTAYDRAAQALLTAIGRRDPLVVLTGTRGLGKTILCRTIVEQLDRHTVTSFVDDPFLSIEGLLKTILVDFGVVSREHLLKGQLRYASQFELAEALRDFLISLAKLQAFAVVILDDAHRMSVEIQRQLRVLIEQMSIADRGESGDEVAPGPLLQLILVGEPDLLTQLRRPALQSLGQHVSLEAELGPLAPDEVAPYLLHRLAVAGNPHVDFDDAALAQVSALAHGVPALVNALCDRVLEEGHRLSSSVIDLPIVEQAAEEIGVAAPASRAARMWSVVLTGLTFTLLVLAGAAAAAYVFRHQLAAIIAGS